MNQAIACVIDLFPPGGHAVRGTVTASGILEDQATK